MLLKENMGTERPIILVGGGTGGHIMPLVAIGEELTSRKVPFIFVGDHQGRERPIVEEYGWKFAAIKSGKFRRQLSWAATFHNMVDLGRTVVGFFESLGLLIRTRAKVVFSKGGYVALPMVLAAKILGRRIIIHESDSVMGLTNRISARLAAKVLTAFAVEIFPNHDARYEQVGIPIRLALRLAASLKSPRKSRPIVLILAGIQGSKAINRLVREALPKLLPLTDVVHITGEAESQLHKDLALNLAKKFKGVGGRSDKLRVTLKETGVYRTFPFITRELPYYYQAADLVISRASATTTAEAALFGKALFLIPLPTATSDHQLKNAKYLQSAGAAVLREEQSLTSPAFTEDIKRLLADKAQRENLGNRLRGYFNEEKVLPRIIELIIEAKD